MFVDTFRVMDHTSVAGAPNHMETLMNHTGEIMLASQQNMSGGQAMSLWNVFTTWKH